MYNSLLKSFGTLVTIVFVVSVVAAVMVQPAVAGEIEGGGTDEFRAVSLTQDGDGQAYVVQRSDTLWILAEKYLGDGNRYAEIVTTTNTKHQEDDSFATISDANRIAPGMKLWIPTFQEIVVVPASDTATGQVPEAAVTTAPMGHIAFSFWNNSPQRCTYEIDIIDVSACLQSPEACQANRHIFSLNAISEPALSPDGQRLAFRGWGDTSSEESPYLNCAPALKARYLANTTLDGTELRGTGGFWEDAHPDWSPDGQRLLFDSQRVPDRVWRIFLINPDGTDEQDLRIAGQQPSWAPDNQRFVYRGCDLTGNRCGLWLANAFPAKSWETGINMRYSIVEDQTAAHPDWSPVSDQVVYQTSSSGNWDLAIVNAAEAGNGNTATPKMLTTSPTIEGLPVWAPDGEWIAFLSDEGGNWGIWIVRPDGTDRQQIFAYDGGVYVLPIPAEPYGVRDWLDEQISWSK